jgi:GNAT superfamily N-acetyltransferase
VSAPHGVRRATGDDAAWLAAVFRERWGGTTMLVHGEELDLTALPAFVYGEHAGVAVVRFGEPAELVLLHALVPGRGVGTALLDAVAAMLRERGTRALVATTTNDNLEALRFYQRHGFRLRALRAGAVDAARERKPAIPRVADNGIPISDELDLECRLD